MLQKPSIERHGERREKLAYRVGKRLPETVRDTAVGQEFTTKENDGLYETNGLGSQISLP